MISDIRLAQIIAVITELSDNKKQDLYRFLTYLKKKIDTVANNDNISEIKQTLSDLQRALGSKVDKTTGKGLSSNDFTNELRTKLVNLVGNSQANWNTTDEQDPSYIANKPDLSLLGLSDEDKQKINNSVQKEEGKGLTSNDFTDEEKEKLSNLSEQEQVDWNETDVNSKSYIKNKPTIPSSSGGTQIQADWSQSDTTKLDFIKNKPTIPDAQIQSDWNQTDVNAKDYIKNKPTIPVSTGNGTQVQADWNQSDNSKPDFIKNKPTIPDAQIQSDWSQSDNTKKDFIKNKPSIPDAQIQSDWNQNDNTKKDFIKNKPTIPNISGCEVTSNKVTSLSSASTDTEYPSAKCVYDIVGNIESTLNAILGV